MPDFETSYPSEIVFQDGKKLLLSLNDNQNRVLITETTTSIQTLKTIFANEGFNETMVEEKKVHQVAQGLMKRLTNEWDIHVRFLELHKGAIAIDAEVETSREYIDHLSGKWISVIYEVTSILQRHEIKFAIWHGNAQQYVKSVLKNIKLTLSEIQGKIEWKPIVAGAAIGIGIGLILRELLKDSDDDN